jgi:hypothetical protein
MHRGPGTRRSRASSIGPTTGAKSTSWSRRGRIDRDARQGRRPRTDRPRTGRWARRGRRSARRPRGRGGPLVAGTTSGRWRPGPRAAGGQPACEAGRRPHRESPRRAARQPPPSTRAGRAPRNRSEVGPAPEAVLLCTVLAPTCSTAWAARAVVGRNGGAGHCPRGERPPDEWPRGRTMPPARRACRRIGHAPAPAGACRRRPPPRADRRASQPSGCRR